MNESRSPKLSFWPKSERPRERLFALGVEALSDIELLAILISHGKSGKTAFDVAKEVLEKCSDFTVHCLEQISGIGKVKATRIAAGIELGKRLVIREKPIPDRIQDSKSVYELMRHRLFGQKIELFFVIAVDVKNRPILIKEIARGTSEGVSFLPRDVMSEAVRINASGIICVHNHPSGDAEPSKEDHMLTKRLRDAALIIGIRFLDHVVIGHAEYYSFVEERISRER